MDVVTANPESWNFDPFTLTRDGVSCSWGGVVAKDRGELQQEQD